MRSKQVARIRSAVLTFYTCAINSIYTCSFIKLTLPYRLSITTGNNMSVSKLVQLIYSFMYSHFIIKPAIHQMFCILYFNVTRFKAPLFCLTNKILCFSSKDKLIFPCQWFLSTSLHAKTIMIPSYNTAWSEFLQTQIFNVSPHSQFHRMRSNQYSKTLISQTHS